MAAHRASIPAFPFIPKSTRWLERGQFWALPLTDGRFGAGCVVGFHLAPEGERSTRLFVAGVIDWIGEHAPATSDLRGRSIVTFAFAHIKAITTCGAMLGQAEQLDYRGAPAEAEALSLPMWGYAMPGILATRLIAAG